MTSAQLRRVILESKRCPDCGDVKPSGEFCRDASRSSGLAAYCRECAKLRAAAQRLKPSTRERNKVYQRNWARQPSVREKALAYHKTDRGREVKRNSKRKARYGVDREGFAAMLGAQHHRCAACRKEFAGTRDTHVDHCHRTGKVRGVLCGSCNRALGAVDDDEAKLLALRDYLQRARLAPKLEVMARCVG